MARSEDSFRRGWVENSENNAHGQSDIIKGECLLEARVVSGTYMYIYFLNKSTQQTLQMVQRHFATSTQKAIGP